MKTQPIANDNPVSLRRQEFIEALKAEDIDRIAEIFAEDAVYMPPNDTTLYGRAEVRAWHEEYRQYFRVAAFTVPEQDVTMSGDWAIERSSFMIAITPSTGGSRIRDDGRVLAIWRRDAGGLWNISQQLWNSVKPVGIGTNRYMARLMYKKASVKR